MINTYIKLEDGTLIHTKGIYGGQRSMRGKIRNSLEIKLNGDYSQIKDIFTDNLLFSVHQKHMENEDVVHEETFDKSEYCLGGDIIDHRDGSFTVYMGMKTSEELLEEENAWLLYKMLTGEEY